MKFCSHKFLISSSLSWNTPREGLGAAKLFMVMNGNDVTVNIKGGATHNRKQLLQAYVLDKVDPKFL